MNIIYFSKTGGFFCTALHGDNIPQDAIEISVEEYDALLEGQSNGKRISADLNGRPTLADQPKASAADVWGRIKAERDLRKVGGVKVADCWFHTDDPSRIQYGILDGKATRAALPGSAILHPAWKTMSGEKMPMTVTLLRQVLDAVIILEGALFDAAETHKAAMEAGTDPSAYDYSAGWPKIYGD